MKICTVVGARPQFIKAATLSRVIAKDSVCNEVLIHTGQHYDHNMSESFFIELELPKPNYHLGIGSGSHGVQTGKMLSQIESVLLDEKPDWLVVYGDTNSTLAGALAGAKLHIPVAHIEAGLRSFNRKMPEEINRIATDSISHSLFCPTSFAQKQLQKEGFSPSQIHFVGDVMFDATLYYNELLTSQAKIPSLPIELDDEYILTTIHRAENTDMPSRLTNIVNALVELSEQHKIILPLHPRTEKYLREYELYARLDNSIDLIEPVGYLDMLILEKHAKLIITDSGGVQKEAFFNQKPCITLRDETEWLELVELGWNKLCPPSKIKSLTEQVENAIANSAQLPQAAPYGSGNAAELILSVLKNTLP
jgi:UDP-GlcNAc3NAcA epimerase